MDEILIKHRESMKLFTKIDEFETSFYSKYGSNLQWFSIRQTSFFVQRRVLSRHDGPLPVKLSQPAFENISEKEVFFCLYQNRQNFKPFPCKIPNFMSMILGIKVVF